MSGRTYLERNAWCAAVGQSALALALAMAVPAGVAQAGIFRDVMDKIGMSKPAAPPAGAPGTNPEFPRQGYACCNLRYDGDWISDSNHAELPMVAAGTPITVMGYGKNRANIDVQGKPMRLGHDDGRDQESLDAWVNKLIVNEDPRPRISTYPATVQAAIRAGKVMRGMTREQAIAAVGYPPTNENKSLDSPIWRMWNSRRGEYQLNFGPDWRITSINGDGDVTSQVIYLPR